jgi:hypothetical protein
LSGGRSTTFITDDPADHFQIETSFDFRFFSFAPARSAPMFGDGPFLPASPDFME